MKIGISSTGAMGVTFASIFQSNGHDVYWASENRSDNSKKRAIKFDVKDCLTLDNLCGTCDVIFSILPGDTPAAQFAQRVLDAGFDGIYIDANTLNSDVSVNVLIEIAHKSKFLFSQMAVRGFPIEDIRDEYPESNKIYVDEGLENLIKFLFKNNNWSVTVVKEGSSKNIIRNWRY